MQTANPAIQMIVTQFWTEKYTWLESLVESVWLAGGPSSRGKSEEVEDKAFGGTAFGTSVFGPSAIF